MTLIMMNQDKPGVTNETYRRPRPAELGGLSQVLPIDHQSLAYCGAETTHNTRSHRARPICHRHT